MANATCRGCTEHGWLGLREGVKGPRYHERSVAGPDGGGQLEIIPCVAHLKKPKKVTTWRTCPNCGSRATKIMSANTGKFTCQICNHSYYDPSDEPKGAGRDWAGRVYPEDFAEND